MLTKAISPPRGEKISTIQLKQALQKIKQTQLEVLKELRGSGDGPMINDSRIKSINDSIEAHMPYIKSISQVSLLKTTEISNMKRQMEREKDQTNQQIRLLQQKNQNLENQLALKYQMQNQWNKQKQFLNEQIKLLTTNSSLENKNINIETFSKQQIISYQQQLNEQTKQKMALQSQMKILQQQITTITLEKERFKNQIGQLLAQQAQKQKNHFEADIKYAEFNQEKRIPLEKIIESINTITQYHQKIYQSLKSRTRITINDLNNQEKIQQSISKIFALIENNQKYSLQKLKQIDEDSVINGYKGSDNESFQEDVKKINKELFDFENIKKQLTELKKQNIVLKEQKRLIQIECKNVRQKLIKNALKNTPEENDLKMLRNQIGSIIEINESLREQNEKCQKFINKLSFDCETFKHQISKYEKTILKNYENLENYQQQIQNLKQQLKSIEKSQGQKDSIQKNQQRQIDQLQINLQNQFQKTQDDIKQKLMEIASLRQQIDRNYIQVRELRQIAYKFQQLEVENQNLKKKIMQINGTVIHLWQIKEIQYENIDKIISTISSM